ncbi:thioredoxin family protein [Maricaulis sp. CAU 1757]
MRFLTTLLACLALFAPAAFADDAHPRPFDGNFSAMAEVDQALEEARAEEKRLLLILGSNWCHDSRGLAHHFSDPHLAATLEQHFVTRYVDVGWRDQNQDVARRFGVPAVYATPTVLVIDAREETLLNRDERSDWTTAASRPVEEARAWFDRWAVSGPPRIGLLESSLVYQAMLVEIEIYEEAEATRLARAYRDIATWQGLPAEERPDDFGAREAEVEIWRRALPREIASLQSEARRLVAAELASIAGGEPISAETVAELDAGDPDLFLEYTPHTSEHW